MVRQPHVPPVEIITPTLFIYPRRESRHVTVLIRQSSPHTLMLNDVVAITTPINGRGRFNTINLRLGLVENRRFPLSLGMSLFMRMVMVIDCGWINIGHQLRSRMQINTAFTDDK
jgi:hypothetical protein